MIARSRSGTEITLIVGLAVPIALSLVLRSTMAVVDTMIVARHSALELAALGLGSALWLSTFAFVSGALLITAPIISARHGAADTASISGEVGQLLWFALGLGALGSLAINLLAFLLPHLGVQPALASRAALYLHLVSVAMPGAALFQVGRYASEGLKLLAAPTLVAVAGFAINVALSSWFVFGGLGLPAMGAAGCALATVGTMWLMAAAMLLNLSRGRHYREFKLVRLCRVDRRCQAMMIRRGIPVGIMLFLEVGIFGLVAVGAGRLGAQAAASHQIAISIANLLFMVPLALSLALAIRVAHLRGAGDEGSARLSARYGIGMCAILSLGFAVALIAAAPFIAHQSVRDVEVATIAVRLLWLAAFLQVADSLQVAFAGVLRGYGDTFTPMLITLGAFWAFGAPLGLWLAFSSLQLGLTGLWIGLLAGIAAAAAALGLRTRALVRAHSTPIPLVLSAG